MLTSRSLTYRALYACILSFIILIYGACPHRAAADEELPYTFFFSNWVGTKFESTGMMVASAPDGSTILLTGKGGWDPATGRANGGGDYTLRAPDGALIKGQWRALDFIAFQYIDGRWDVSGDTITEWQGPAGSATFSGFLSLRVNLDQLGNGVLRMWCIPPMVIDKPVGYAGDGISLTSAMLHPLTRTRLNFTQNQATGIVMFYSVDPASEGYVLDRSGHMVAKVVAKGQATPSSQQDSPASATPLTHLPATGMTSIIAYHDILGMAVLIVGLFVTGIVLRRWRTQVTVQPPLSSQHSTTHLA